jgi:hypothetical protein
MPALGAGIHVFLGSRRGWHRNSGLPELRIIITASRVNPTCGDKPGHDARCVRSELDKFYRPAAGSGGAGVLGSAGSGSLRTGAAGAAKPSASRAAGSAASAIAAWPSAVG